MAFYIYTDNRMSSLYLQVVNFTTEQTFKWSKVCIICSKTQYKGIKGRQKFSEYAKAHNILKAVTKMKDDFAFLSCHLRGLEGIYTLHCSCVNVKELLNQNRCDIWNLSDCNEIRAHKPLDHKQTINHLANLPNSWAVLWFYICMLHFYLVICAF